MGAGGGAGRGAHQREQLRHGDRAQERRRPGADPAHPWEHRHAPAAGTGQGVHAHGQRGQQQRGGEQRERPAGHDLAHGEQIGLRAVLHTRALVDGGDGAQRGAPERSETVLVDRLDRTAPVGGSSPLPDIRTVSNPRSSSGPCAPTPTGKLEPRELAEGAAPLGRAVELLADRVRDRPLECDAGAARVVRPRLEEGAAPGGRPQIGHRPARRPPAPASRAPPRAGWPPPRRAWSRRSRPAPASCAWSGPRTRAPARGGRPCPQHCPWRPAPPTRRARPRPRSGGACLPPCGRSRSRGRVPRARSDRPARGSRARPDAPPRAPPWPCPRGCPRCEPGSARRSPRPSPPPSGRRRARPPRGPAAVRADGPAARTSQAPPPTGRARMPPCKRSARSRCRGHHLRNLQSRR